MAWPRKTGQYRTLIKMLHENSVGQNVSASDVEKRNIDLPCVPLVMWWPQKVSQMTFHDLFSTSLWYARINLLMQSVRVWWSVQVAERIVWQHTYIYCTTLAVYTATPRPENTRKIRHVFVFSGCISSTEPKWIYVNISKWFKMK